ncbi:MAG: hypothetical protein JST47_01715 [Bacteroidetes bacterium]|nr:hypothetical protein [Bacteroidota bacterium]MBS1973009.1 hypothetical protein [Bacteroidota bacterium]
MRFQILLISGLLVCARLSFAQSSVTVNSTIDKNEILVGEQIRLSLDVKVSLGFNPSWFLLDTIPHFDIVSKGRIDSLITEDGKSYHQNIIITSFDSGMHAIPKLPIVIGGKSFFTDSIPVTVKFTTLGPKQEYHDIKDILDVPYPYTRYIVWSIIFVTVISIGLVIYFITSKQSVAPKEEMHISKLTPYEEAIQSLEELKQQQLPEQGQVKLYYSRLNDILRLFVLRKLQIASMAKTNEEIIVQLKSQQLSNEQNSQLSKALRVIDFVKFAKYLPSENDNEENYNVIKSSVEILNEIGE